MSDHLQFIFTGRTFQATVSCISGDFRKNWGWPLVNQPKAILKFYLSWIYLNVETLHTFLCKTQNETIQLMKLKKPWIVVDLVAQGGLFCSPILKTHSSFIIFFCYSFRVWEREHLRHASDIDPISTLSLLYLEFCQAK